MRKAIYKVIDHNNQIIFKGTIYDIEEHFNISNFMFYYYADKDKLLEGKYLVRKTGEIKEFTKNWNLKHEEVKTNDDYVIQSIERQINLKN